MLQQLGFSVSARPFPPVSGARSISKTSPPVALRFGESADIRPRRTQIVASLGPASNNAATMEGMIRAGADVFRIDFAKGTHESHAQTVATLREVALRLRDSGEVTRPIRLMADLQGPRIALGQLPQGGIQLTTGASIRLSGERADNAADVLSVTYPDLIRAMKPGNKLLIDDARLVVEVTEAASPENGETVTAKVIQGGTAKSNMVINAPDVEMVTPALTEKDQADLAFALDQGFEVITQSFPASDLHVLEARQRINARNPAKPPVLIAKIERPQSVEPAMLRAIAQQADAVMVARGDLGTEMGLVQLPRLQQRIIETAHAVGKQAVVANKLLGSMVKSTRPSRSDVFDVAESVKNSADMLMLTTETASGQYPVESVKMADAIIREYEPVEPKADNNPLITLKNLAHQFVERVFEELSNWLHALLNRAHT